MAASLTFRTSPLPDRLRVRPNPDRGHTLLVDGPFAGKREGHLQRINNGGMCAFFFGDSKRVRSTQVAGSRANAKAVLGAVPRVTNIDSPNREFAAWPLSNVGHQGRSAGRTRNVDSQCRREESFFEEVNKPDIFTAEQLIDLIDRCSQFDAACAPRGKQEGGVGVLLCSNLGAPVCNAEDSDERDRKGFKSFHSIDLGTTSVTMIRSIGSPATGL